MTRKQDNAGVRQWSEEIRKALSEDRDLLKTIVEEPLQQVLEGEMEETLQAGKSERTETRLGTELVTTIERWSLGWAT